MANKQAVEAYPVDGAMYQQQGYVQQASAPPQQGYQQPYQQSYGQQAVISQPYSGPTAQQATAVGTGRPVGHVVVVQGQSPAAAVRKPHTYCCLSVVTCLFCCWPIGLFAIFKSYKVNDYFRRGEFEKSYAASEMAKKASIAAIIFGIVLYVAGSVAGTETTANDGDGSFNDG